MLALRGSVVFLLTSVLVIGAAACDDATRRRALSVSSPTPTPELRNDDGVPQGRPETQPATTLNVVRYITRGPADSEEARRIARAVRDLRELGYWKELTAHVVRVAIAGRPGAGRVPRDGRLAQAVSTLHTTGRYPGSWCEIAIFPHALEEDIERQAVYYSQGRLAAPPPSLREFWAVILAHELAHCSPRGQKGEAYSTEWEARVLAAFGRARVGSPSS